MRLAEHPHGAAATAPPADSEWRRLSARMLLVHPVRELVRNIPTLVVLLVAGQSRGGSGQWWSLIGVGVVIAASIARWFTTRYRITPEQVQLRKGLLRRRTITTPADRVRSVDVSASALHRVLGLAKVEIGTGVSDSKKEGMVLDGLATAAANGLRAELLHRGRSGLGSLPAPAVGAEAALLPPPAVVDGSSALDEASEEVELTRLQARWILYAPFTLSGILTTLTVAAVGSRLVSEAHLDIGRTSAYQQAVGRVDTTPLWVSVLVGVVALVVLIGILSLLAYVLAFWGFRLTRHSRGTLQVSRGLITTRATSIEERRLRGVEVSEPLLLRAVGGSRLIAITTGLRVGRGAQRGGSMIVPPAPDAEVCRVAAEVLHLVPDRGDPDGGVGDLVSGPLTPHGPRARRRRWLRAFVPGVALLVVWLVLQARGWPLWLAIVPATVVVTAPLLAADRYAALGHRLSGGYLVTRFGSLVRRRSVVATDGIIGWNIDATYFQRRAGLVTMAATTAAGDQAYCIWDVPSGDALELARHAIPGLLDPFLVPDRGGPGV